MSETWFGAVSEARGDDGCSVSATGIHGSVPPNPLSPMLASPGPVPSGPEWVHEWKWDGQRAAAVVDGSFGAVKLLSRNGNDVTASFREIVSALLASAGAAAFVVDGEIVALNPAGQPDFGLLRRRMHVKRPSAALLRETPVSLFVFDVLDHGGQSVREWPYVERRQLLDDLELTDGWRIQVPANMTSVDGDTLMTIAAESGIEGVVAKRAQSVYRPGVRSKSWIKTPIRRNRDAVICGWVPTGGRAGGALAALLLGAYDTGGALVYMGSVGTGFTDRVRRELRAGLASIIRPESPFEVAVPAREAIGVSWVEPVVVAIVDYREQSTSGRLRHPSFKGVRADVAASDVLL